MFFVLLAVKILLPMFDGILISQLKRFTAIPALHLRAKYLDVKNESPSLFVYPHCCAGHSHS